MNSSDDNVTQWIRLAKAGDQVALEKLWEKYFSQLVRLAQRKLRDKNYRFRMAGAEDAALSAFQSLWKGIEHGRFPELHDRDNLWRILVVITARKAGDYVAHELAQKRGGGKVRGESILQNAASDDLRGFENIVGDAPTPAFAAEVAEGFSQLMETLQDKTLRNVALWKMEGYTKTEIAQKLGVSESTVARKLSLIRKRLAAGGFGRDEKEPRPNSSRR